MASTLHRIKPGVQKWPFKFLLPTTLPESVEGLASTYIGYWLHASAERSYMGSKLFAQSKRIRLIRTLGVDALDSINLEQASVRFIDVHQWY